MKPHPHISISEGERQRVRAAITQAEKGTSGEIVVVAAQSSDDYIHVPIYIATALALAVPLLAPWIARLFPWNAVSFQEIFFIQLAVFIVFAVVLSIPGLRWLVTPRSVMRKYAHHNAAAQFLATNIAATRGRTGVLLFVSLFERHVEVIGDEAIAAKLKQGDWQQIIDEMLPLLRDKRIADALVFGVEHCGALLAKHFPAGHENANELPDRFIILS